MSTSVWPPLAAVDIKIREDESLARELSWLLESLQETLDSLKSGLEDCYALLAPTEPGSTLVISSVRSESIKGHITRVGTRIVKGSIHLRLRTHAPTHLRLSSDQPLILEHLTILRSLLNQSLDCVDITRWTGDRHSAPFISSQLHLLHSILLEAISLLKGPSILTRTSQPPEPSTWNTSAQSPDSFDPPLPPSLSLFLTLHEASLLLTVRVLESTTATPNLGSRFAFAIGAQRRLEHDEMDEVFEYRGDEVRVKEKIRVESADPSLLSVMAKLGALERTVDIARRGLAVVMGGGIGHETDD